MRRRPDNRKQSRKPSKRGHKIPTKQQYRVLERSSTPDSSQPENTDNISFVPKDYRPSFNRQRLKQAIPGDFVKVIFGGKERMWVEVIDCCSSRWTGLLDNDPVVLTELSCGDFVEFSADDIIDMWSPA